MRRGEEGTVRVYAARAAPEHEKAVLLELGRRIARLLDMRFGGEHDGSSQAAGRQYLIPADTIIGTRQADHLGLRRESDLFGGMAPYAFLPTKAIAHTLHSADARAPAGWSHAFGEQVRDCVLKGYTAFSLSDAAQAGRRLLQSGPVRIKPVMATGGRDQEVVTDFGGLQEVLARQDALLTEQCGLVLEEHLDPVETFSVGQVRIGRHLASYVGVQRLTPDNRDKMVYGGSELIVSRGDFDRLLKLELDEIRLDVIDRAQRFDKAVSRHYPSVVASRRNYDVVRGRDAGGKWRTGVLEQSWRMGGASAAEIAALETFDDHGDVNVVIAATTEIFGDNAVGPIDATQLFQGIDSEIGPLSKFVAVRPYGG